MPWRTSVQHGIPSWMDPTSCYQKTDSTFYVKKTEKKLVSQNFEPLKSNIMLENSIFSSPFLLFTFWEFLFFVYVHPMSVANRREKTQVGPHVLDACWVGQGTTGSCCLHTFVHKIRCAHFCHNNFNSVVYRRVS